jgi:hypothetical protein
VLVCVHVMCAYGDGTTRNTDDRCHAELSHTNQEHGGASIAKPPTLIRRTELRALKKPGFDRISCPGSLLMSYTAAGSPPPGGVRSESVGRVHRDHGARAMLAMHTP